MHISQNRSYSTLNFVYDLTIGETSTLLYVQAAPMAMCGFLWLCIIRIEFFVPWANVPRTKRHQGINTIKLFLPLLNCHKITSRFWFIVWDAQLVFKWRYLCLLLRIRTLSSWWSKFTDANPFSAWNNSSKIAEFFTAVVLWPKWVYSMFQRLVQALPLGSDRYQPTEPFTKNGNNLFLLGWR